ncbi:MAG TPA: non-homologous end-joining DNA ligase [Bacteroidales bacterium]|nr:non-homologous end-joining DNA ligase [Bacteroidales bacterium]
MSEKKNKKILGAGKFSFELTHGDKVLFPGAGITKHDLINYYDSVSELMLPFLKDRPVMLHRYTGGIGEKGFYQKDRSDYFPEWIESVKVKKESGGTNDMVLINNKSTLLYLVNQDMITAHIWLSTKNQPDKPDIMVFDLDPPDGGNFEQVITGAKVLKAVVEEEAGLEAFIKLSGSAGLHITIPVKADKKFEEVRNLAKEIAEFTTDKNADLFTTTLAKKGRNGKLFIDYLRNSYAQTIAAPYAVRPLKNGPVAAPLHWEEVNNELSARKYTLENILQRVSHTEDPWKNFRQHARKIPSSMK